MRVANQHRNYLISFLLYLLIFLPFSLQASTDEDFAVPFQLINGLIILEAEIEGVEGHFLLDTGADAILLDGNPEEADQVLATLGGDVKMASKQIERLQIGSFIQYKVAAQVTSLSILEQQLGIDLSGIIGGSFFKPRTLVMDFSNAMLTISSTLVNKAAIKQMKRLKFEMVHQIPIVEIKMEQRTYKFALDSGASIHLLDDKLIAKLKNIKALSMHSNISSVDKVSLKKRYMIPKFSMGTINFSGHHCLSHNFEDINTELQKPISGILSISSLAKDKVVIDFKNNVLYF